MNESTTLRRTTTVIGAPRTVWAGAGLIVLGIALLAVAPAVMTPFGLGQMGRFVCYAIVAVGIGIAWGRGGMLTLGQGAFFGIGAYVMAMHMLLADGEQDDSGIPSFMSIAGATDVPGWWEPFRSPVVTLVAVVALPALVAFALGFSIFKRRIKGAYFAILNQALVAATVVLLVGQQTTLGGSDGLSGFNYFMGYDLEDPANKRMLFYLSSGTLLAMLAIAYWLMRSRYGELLVATRDAEERVRFLGYDPALVKTAAYVIAAAMAGIAGALFVPIVGIISPTEIGVVPSIIFVIGVAVGGRTSLFGPALGALAMAWMESSLAQVFPSGWSYIQGLLLVLVIALLPGGLASVGGVFRRRKAEANAADATATPAVQDTEKEKVNVHD
ncbi:MAG TPA: urea ABC transporter permease subunit UrtC [Candidatus Corynebacterium avicola]|uniref:Urea ABC transporter permease subunit UrtC n=1 Tax=Candidatus Corynebacterium avicola TaxID=2838527 RepID=A0A9D1UMG7_9CORY|nr:urea ABC transporter permease subunit UrtC [Candidatus Corynebacterium avicola]